MQFNTISIDLTDIRGVENLWYIPNLTFNITLIMYIIMFHTLHYILYFVYQLKV